MSELHNNQLFSQSNGRTNFVLNYLSTMPSTASTIILSALAATASPAFSASVAYPSPSPPALSLPGQVISYLPKLGGLAASSCPSSYPSKPSTPCHLDTFQEYPSPLTPVVSYGNRLIYTVSQVLFNSWSHVLVSAVSVK